MRVTGHGVGRGRALLRGRMRGQEGASEGVRGAPPAGPIHGHTATVGARGGGTGVSRLSLAETSPERRSNLSDIGSVSLRGPLFPPPHPPGFHGSGCWEISRLDLSNSDFQPRDRVLPLSATSAAAPPPAPRSPSPRLPPNSTDTRGSPCTCSPRSLPAGSLSVIAAVTPAPLAVPPPPPPHVRGTAGVTPPKGPQRRWVRCHGLTPRSPAALQSSPPLGRNVPLPIPHTAPRSGDPPTPFPSPLPRGPHSTYPPPPSAPSPGTRREDVAGWGRGLRDPPGDAAAPVPTAGCGAGAGAGAGLTCVCGRPRAFTSGRDRGAICTAGLRSGRALKPKTRSGPNHCQTRRPRAFMGGLEQGR